MQVSAAGSDMITGMVDTITYRNESNGYTVAMVKTDKENVSSDVRKSVCGNAF